MRVSTKVPGFQASGRIVNARDWIKGSGAGANPKVEPDDSPASDHAFEDFDRGVSVTVRFDAHTHPKKLDWLQANSAKIWYQILRIKTAIGSIVADDRVSIHVSVKSGGKSTVHESQGTSYLWLHKIYSKSASVRELEATTAVQR